MYCPQCATDNLETSARCIQCGHSLLGSAAPLSESAEKTATAMNAKMFSTYGGLAGAVLAVVAMQWLMRQTHWSDWELGYGAIAGWVLGNVAGRLVAQAFSKG